MNNRVFERFGEIRPTTRGESGRNCQKAHLSARTFLGSYNEVYELSFKSSSPYNKAMTDENSVWCPHKMKCLYSIEEVQRRETKMLPGMENLNYRDITKNEATHSCVPSSERRLIEVYKIMHGLYDKKKFHQRSYNVPKN